MLPNNDNQYGMTLTAEETKETLERYAHGWTDYRAALQPTLVEVEEDLNRVLWNIKPITWRPKPVHLMLGGAAITLVLAILIKVMT
jgi:hypothetical protein